MENEKISDAIARSLMQLLLEASSHLGVPPTVKAEAVDTGPASEPPRGPLILQLPNEILQQIFERAGSFKTERGLPRKLEFLSLALTCRRFYSVSMPLIYADPLHRALLLGPRRDPDRITLVNTLVQKPSLSNMVRTIALNGGGSSAGRDFPLLLLLVSSLVNVEQLSFLLDFELSHHWTDFGSALKKMHKLKSLVLQCRWRNGPPLHQILKTLELPSLRVLELRIANFQSNVEVLNVDDYSENNGRGLFEDGDKEFTENDSNKPSQDGNSESSETRPVKPFSAHREGTSGVTSLCLNTPKHGPEELAELLAWPKALEHFSTKNTWPADQSWWSPWSMSNFNNSLRPQRTSLKSINGCRVENDVGCIDVTDFVQLEYLEIHWYSIHCSPDEAAIKMLGPKLRTITFDVEDPSPDEDDDHLNCFHTIDQDAAQWLISFAQSAQAHGSLLKEIKLLLSSYPKNYVLDGHLDMQTINARLNMLENLEQQLEELGIKLSSQIPSREEFQTYAEQLANGTASPQFYEQWDDDDDDDDDGDDDDDEEEDEDHR